MEENKMDISDTYVFSPNAKVITNQDKTVVVNRRSGLWMKIPTQCYEILSTAEERHYTLYELYSTLHDEEDRQYMKTIIENLSSAELLVDSHYTVPVHNNISKVYFLLTHRCNLRCRHCCMDSGLITEHDYLSYENIIHGINEIASLNPEIVVFSGGEPLLRTDIFDIADYAVEKCNLNLHLITNGTLITEDNVISICKYFKAVSISIDGVDEESCSIIRGKGTYNKVITAINLLKKYGMTTISLSLEEIVRNQHYTSEFYNLCQTLGVSPAVRVFAEDGRGTENYNKLVEDYKKYYTRYPVDQGDMTYNSPQMYVSDKKIKVCNCLAAIDNISVNFNGDIFPCNLLCDKKYKIGNICDDQLLELLSTERIKNSEAYENLKGIQPDIHPKCKLCKVNLFCHTCPHTAEFLWNHEDKFQAYCSARKKPLYQLIWNEDI